MASDYMCWAKVNKAIGQSATYNTSTNTWRVSYGQYSVNNSDLTIAIEKLLKLLEGKML